MTMRKSLIAPILLLVTAFAYANTLTNRFVWDDDAFVTQNDVIRNSTYIDRVFTSDLFGDNPTSIAYYRPLQTISYMVDYFFWGLNPLGYHVTNIALHLLCVVLVWVLVERLSANRLLGALVAAVFAVHPVNTNAVTYISGRADPMAFAAMLGSFLLFLRYRSSDGETAQTRTLLFVASMLCYVLALFSRESALLLPILIVLYELALSPRTDRKLSTALASVVPFLLITVAYVLFRTAVTESQGKAFFTGATTPVSMRLQVIFAAMSTYVGLLTWPAHLQMDRHFIPGDAGLHMLTVAGILTAVVLAWAIWWSYRVSRLASFGLIWFAVTLLPMTGTLNLITAVAEHWLYVPSVGFYLAVGAVCYRMLTQSTLPAEKCAHKLAGILYALILLALTARTIVRNRDWADDMTIYSHTRQAAPYSVRMRSNLGHLYLAEGHFDNALSELLNAEQHCRRGPLLQIIKGNLAAVYAAKGDFDRAIAKNQECLQLDANDTDAWLRLANICEQRGNLLAARRYYAHATATSASVKSRLLFGMFLLSAGRLQEALQTVREAYDIEPGNAEVFNLLGAILIETGQLAKARETFEMAQTLDRHSPAAVLNLGHLALRQGDLSRAAACYQRVLEIQPKDLRALYQLGLVLWRQRELDQAESCLRQALLIAPNNPTVRAAWQKVLKRERFHQAGVELARRG
jgi:Flp pilus assembly protein TadD